MSLSDPSDDGIYTNPPQSEENTGKINGLEAVAAVYPVTQWLQNTGVVWGHNKTKQKRLPVLAVLELHL